jgi:hypothetical protein
VQRVWAGVAGVAGVGGWGGVGWGGVGWGGVGWGGVGWGGVGWGGVGWGGVAGQECWPSQAAARAQRRRGGPGSGRAGPAMRPPAGPLTRELQRQRVAAGRQLDVGRQLALAVVQVGRVKGDRLAGGERVGGRAVDDDVEVAGARDDALAWGTGVGR